MVAHAKKKLHADDFLKLSVWWRAGLAVASPISEQLLIPLGKLSQTAGVCVCVWLCVAVWTGSTKYVLMRGALFTPLPWNRDLAGSDCSQFLFYSFKQSFNIRSASSMKSTTVPRLSRAEPTCFRVDVVFHQLVPQWATIQPSGEETDSWKLKVSSSVQNVNCSYIT